MRRIAAGAACALAGWLLGHFGTSPARAQAPAAGPSFQALGGSVLRVRGANEATFGPKSRGIPVEVYRDRATGNLLYVSETGSIAVIAPR